MSETVYSVVGKRLPRVDAVEKVTGVAKYGADLNLPGMLYGEFLRSPHSHAKIIRIDTRKAERLRGVKAIITPANLSMVASLATEDSVHGMAIAQDLFAVDTVRYQGEKLAVVAATDPDIAEDAVSLIEVEYEVLPPVFDVVEAIQPGAPRIHDHVEPVRCTDGDALHKLTGIQKEWLFNIANETHIHHGDVEKGFAEADEIFEDVYRVPRVHQTYIEPHAVVASVDPSGRVTVWTSTQGIFAIRAGVSSSLGIPMSKINVIGSTIGGGFGGKFGMLVHPYAVLLSQRTGKPVKIVMSREEEFLDGRPAPGALMWVKTGVQRDGTMTARQSFSLWDTGSVSGAGAGAMMRIRGVYKIQNIKVDGFGVYTHQPGPSAYRAPSAPQAAFASEAQLDRIAHELGIDPVDLRLKNMAEDGDSLGGGRLLTKVAFKETLRKVAEHVDWWNRKREPNRGWGVAVGEWTNGAGPAGTCISIQEDGTVKVFSGLMDITGTDTAMSQIAAETLGVPYEDVTVVRGDTDSVPYMTGSGGSVVTFSAGNAVKRAAEDARRRVLTLASEHLGVPVERLTIAQRNVSVTNDPGRSITLAELGQASLRTTGGPIVGNGTFANEPSHPVIAAQIAHVEVDPETGDVTILRFAGSLDCGFAINPVQVEGQMEGGAVQGLSWGLMEEMKYGGHGNLNPHLLDYRIPTALDLPKLESLIVEAGSEHGPFGVKGVGEPPIIPTIATMASAIADAIGVRINEAPMTPERIVMALKKRNGR
ncbi:MAG: xanthine dehydrogenase family protein molybdopterin-binding subunit [Candidatus Latescibacteria bacterium]|nr:xanthine dehydrogenase family protein molybdopterin-binding subunit [Candidatus Latescibacterota bacterium]